MLAWSAVLAVSKGILLYDPLQCSHLSMYINLVTYDSPCMRRKEAQTFSPGNRSASKVNLSKIDKVTHNEHKHRRPRPGWLAPFSRCTVTKLGVRSRGKKKKNEGDRGCRRLLRQCKRPLCSLSVVKEPDKSSAPTFRRSCREQSSGTIARALAID